MGTQIAASLTVTLTVTLTLTLTLTPNQARVGTQIAASVLSALGGAMPSDGVIAAPPRS